MMLNQFLLLAAALFCIGVYGVLTRRNGVLVLMSVELILNAVNINLVAFGAFQDNVLGDVFAVFVIAVAAAEVGVGLAMVLLMVVMVFALVDTFENTEISFSDPEPIAYVPTESDVDQLPTPVVEALNIAADVETITISQTDFDSLDPEVQRRVPGAEVFGNNKQIADSIFSQYIIPFEAVSVLLLAALIGAVAVARTE
jgi:NAD(P)H-quinone oxidoreductase subunit 4L